MKLVIAFLVVGFGCIFGSILDDHRGFQYLTDVPRHALFRPSLQRHKKAHHHSHHHRHSSHAESDTQEITIHPYRHGMSHPDHTWHVNGIHHHAAVPNKGIHHRSSKRHHASSKHGGTRHLNSLHHFLSAKPRAYHHHQDDGSVHQKRVGIHHQDDAGIHHQDDAGVHQKRVGIHYQDCGSKGAAIKSVNITPCGAGPKCILVRGKNVTLDIQFTAKEATSTATTSVHGKVSGIPIFVPFPLPNSDACTAGGMACPVKPGQAEHYQQALAIKREFPPVSAMVKWEIVDEHKSDIICLLIPVQLH